MHCSNCSIEIAEGSKFCPKCGTVTVAPSTENSKNVKKRHGFTTFWLIAGIIIYSIIPISSILDFSNTSDVLTIITAIAHIVGYAFIIYWRHFGFIIVVIATAIDVINILLGGVLSHALISLIILGLLYCVLQIRKDGKSTWAQLK